MSIPVFHRFNAYGPVCGTARGVNAAEMDPPEITCRRCARVEVEWWRRPKIVRLDGRLFLEIENEAHA